MDESPNKADASLETATDDSDLSDEVRSHQNLINTDIDALSTLKASVKETDSKDEEDPVRDWMCAIKIQWLCQAGTN